MSNASSRLAVAWMAIAVSSGGLAAQTGEGGDRPAVVRGRIVDHETGRPVPAATVTLAVGAAAEQPLVRTSDPEGSFEFADVPAGSYTLRVESLGYSPFDDTLGVAADSDVQLEIRVSASPLDLEPIVVVTARRPAFMAGFEERRARGRNHTAFFTAEEIAAKNPDVLTDVFVATPGAHVRQGVTSNTIQVAGTPTGSAMRGCSPDVFVNGVLNTGVPVDEMFAPERVEAVELYTLQHEVPQRFEGPRRCGALVIWLRERAPDDPPATPNWKRLLLALGAVGVTVLLVR